MNLPAHCSTRTEVRLWPLADVPGALTDVSFYPQRGRAAGAADVTRAASGRSRRRSERRRRGTRQLGSQLGARETAEGHRTKRAGAALKAGFNWL